MLLHKHPPPPAVLRLITDMIIDRCVVALLFVLGRVYWGAWDAIVAQADGQPELGTTRSRDQPSSR